MEPYDWWRRSAGGFIWDDDCHDCVVLDLLWSISPLEANKMVLECGRTASWDWLCDRNFQLDQIHWKKWNLSDIGTDLDCTSMGDDDRDAGCYDRFRSNLLQRMSETFPV